MKSNLFSCYILMKLEFSRQIYRNAQISNFMKIHPAQAELFHAYGQTDMMKLISVLRNFANAPKNFLMLNLVV